MLKKMILGAALLVAGAVPAFAQDTCTAPAAPAIVDGTTATREQLVAGINAVKAYIATSDVYQQCVGDYVTAAKAQADKDKKPVDAALLQGEGDKVTANQNSKQKIGDQINASVAAYKKAHPT